MKLVDKSLLLAILLFINVVFVHSSTVAVNLITSLEAFLAGTVGSKTLIKWEVSTTDSTATCVALHVNQKPPTGVGSAGMNLSATY